MNPNGYHNTLLLLRARLLGDMSQMEDNALNKDRIRTTAMPMSMAELGSDNTEQELTLDLLGNEQEVLEQIEAALVRIDDGSYGRCEACGRGIAKARLDAIPYTALCVKCASRQESGGRKPR
jgi:DnaK suppressor protein